MGALLEVSHLRTSFYTQDGIVRAVDDVSFDVVEGEALGIVGESGCGKSVSALSIMRLIPTPPGRIESGEIVFEGQNLLELDPDEMRRIRGKKIAMVFQDPMTSLNPMLTVNKQISEILTLHEGLSRQLARDKTIELLDIVGIPSPAQRADAYPHQFSGGMRQRVMIAMALACSPKLIIADEPTTALDVTIQAQIIDLIMKLRRELKSAVVWISHDLGVVAGLCDRVLVMYAGHVVESSTVRRLYANPRHPYTIGLLRSLPRLDVLEKQKLTSIEGMPPDLIDMPPSCPFVERCQFARELCARERPPLRSVEQGHEVACWTDVTKGSV